MFIAPTVGIGGMSPFKTVYPRKNGRTEERLTDTVLSRKQALGVHDSHSFTGAQTSQKRKRLVHHLEVVEYSSGSPRQK